MAQNWCDLNKDGRRLNRIIRILEKRLMKSNDDDKIIRYANSICMLTREKVNISSIVLGVKEILDHFEKTKKEIAN